MQDTDSLAQRIRDGLLLDVYGALITQKQKLACEMVLMQDLSLSEAAESLKVSRQGVHDLITRAREHMESAENALGLLEKESKYEEILKFLDQNKDHLPKDFYENMKSMLEA
ncbi:MAG: DNA-binding protein [Synergistaceae bacterium]|nr:DNA-binding protein [Synergistaceae bacterium]